MFSRLQGLAACGIVVRESFLLQDKVESSSTIGNIGVQ